MKWSAMPGLGAYLVRHPARGFVMARAGWRLRQRQWWRKPPFLPLPNSQYWEFRSVTAQGVETLLTPHAMFEAAKWSLRQPVGR